MKIKISFHKTRGKTFESVCVWLGLLVVLWSRPAVAQAVYSTPYVFSTLAGHANSGGASGGSGGVRFSNPRGVAVDAAGNIFVADTHDHTICRMTPGGDVTILAGRPGLAGSADGMGSEARFRYPQGVAVDGAGNIYVADSGNNTIRQVTPAGAVTTLAGRAGEVGSADGTGGAARFNYPNGVAVDSSGDVYVADLRNATIRKITPAGTVTTLAGQPGMTGSADGIGSAARFNFPYGVAVDSAENVYVADLFNNAIRKVTPTGAVTTLAGQLTYHVGSGDGAGNNAQFSNPCGLAVDSVDNIYVADTGNHTIRRVTPAGEVVTLAGLAGRAGDADGTGSATRFRHPISIALDQAGNIYVADLGNGAIRKGFPAIPAPISPTPNGSFSSTTH
jgi:sugar lactone lactonase YvrE